MATPLVANDILRVTLASYYGNAKQLGESRLFYRVDVAGAGTLEQVAPFFKTRLELRYRGWLPSSCTFAGVAVQRVFPAPRSGVIYALSGLAGIASTAGALPSQASGLIRFTTTGLPAVAIPALPALPGTKGRAYIPFPCAQYFNPATNGLDLFGRGALRAISTVLGPTITAEGVTFALGVYTESTTRFRPAIAMQESEFIATQRRRGAFGQLNKPFGG